jgi:hypothetical protein
MSLLATQSALVSPTNPGLFWSRALRLNWVSLSVAGTGGTSTALSALSCICNATSAWPTFVRDDRWISDAFTVSFIDISLTVIAMCQMHLWNGGMWTRTEDLGGCESVLRPVHGSGYPQ